jgi:hypothetical protein
MRDAWSISLRFLAAFLGFVGLLAAAWGATRLGDELLPRSPAELNRVAAAGQAYATAGVLLTAISLIGIGATLVLQLRALRQQQMALERTLLVTEQQSGAAQRALHIQLIEHAISDSSLREVLPFLHDDETTARQYLYANLMLSHLESLYERGALGEEAVRQNLRRLFERDVVRSFWVETGAFGRSKAGGGTNEAFFNFCTDAFMAGSLQSPIDTLTYLRFTDSMESERITLKRRFGSHPKSEDRSRGPRPSSGDNGCPDVWELESGDVAVVGTLVDHSAVTRGDQEFFLDPRSERVVVIPREVFESATRDFMDGK